MDKIDGDSIKSESSGEGLKSSVIFFGGNGFFSKRFRYGDDISLVGYQNRKIIYYKIGKEFKMNFLIFLGFNWFLLELLVLFEQILRRFFCLSNRLYVVICFRRSEFNDEDEFFEIKAERERVRRQVNNVRERYVNFLCIYFNIFVLFYKI